MPIVPQIGSWRPVAAMDGGRVLEAGPNSQMTFALAHSVPVDSNWRFRCRVAPLNEATAVVQLPIPTDRLGNVQRLVTVIIARERFEIGNQDLLWASARL